MLYQFRDTAHMYKVCAPVFLVKVLELYQFRDTAHTYKVKSSNMFSSDEGAVFCFRSSN